MSSRLSRPRRTKLYDCNYDMSERYYKPMVDHLDRKYTPGQVREDIPRHFSPLADGYRRREQTPEEVRRRPLSTMLDDFEPSITSRSNGHREDSLSMTDEMSASMKRIAASKAARAAIEDEISELAAMRSSRKAGGSMEFGEKVLDSVGLNNSSISRARESLDDDTFTKRRTLRMVNTDASDLEDNSTITKWTAIKGAGQRMLNDMEDDVGSTAVLRARMSRNRLADLDAEMEQVADRAAARERRNNHLRALVQENQDNSTSEASSSMRIKKTTISQKAEKKTVTF